VHTTRPSVSHFSNSDLKSLRKTNLAAASSQHLKLVTQGPLNRDQGVAESLIHVPDIRSCVLWPRLQLP
jgi:hypothetical protein